MAETPYHDYKRPDKGTPDWNVPLNDNFGAIDADIEVRDSGTPSSNNYDPKQGAKYLDTTSGVVYVGELDNNDNPVWTPAFALAGYDDSAGRPQFGPLGVGTLAGSVTGGTAVSTLAGSGLTIASGSLGLANDSVTVAGNAVSLGGSTGIGHADLTGVSEDQHHPKDHDHTEADISAVPNTGLANSSVTVTAGDGLKNGGSVSLGSSTTLDVEASEVAGNALEDDGSDNLAVSAGGIGTGELTSGAVTSTELSDGTISTADIGQNGASNGHVLRWDGSAWETGFPGTTESTAFALLVNSQIGLRLEPGDGRPVPNVLAGRLPTVPDGIGIVGATVGGGLQNKVYDAFGTVGGGEGNQAGSDDGVGGTARHATVGGGAGNQASDPIATVGGGNGNTASGSGATVGGGNGNTASGSGATVGGGQFNTASGKDATVGGGQNNTASGFDATVPGGKRGAAEGNNSFVWNDGTRYHAIPNDNDDGLSSNTAVDGEPVTGAETFSVSATGGVRFITGGSAVTYIDAASTGWSTTSTRAAKTNIDPVDPGEALAGVDSMEIATWEYTDDDGDGAGTTHIGPMAEGFHDAFDVGSSDEHINSINADGVAFAAIQGLAAKLDEREERIESQADRINELETENETLRKRNAELEDRLAAVEDRLAAIENQSSPAPADD
jgi:hypothetical protein